MPFPDLLRVGFDAHGSDGGPGGRRSRRRRRRRAAGSGGGSDGSGVVVAGVPRHRPGGAAVVGAGGGEGNRSFPGGPGVACPAGSPGGGAEVNDTAAVGGVVVSAQALGVGVFLAAFILAAIAGNLLVILSVACNRHLQTVTNYFIVNLAVADLLLSATVLPFSATMEVLGFWAFGRAFCDVWAAVDVLCCTASILSLCTISVDRYVGVRHSLKYPAIMTERKAAAILALLWAVALVVSVGPLLGWKEPVPPDDRFCGITEEAGYAVFSSVCSFYLPMAVILVMYFRVYVVARRTTRSLEAGVKRERSKSTDIVLRIHCRSSGPDDSRAAKGHNFRSSLSVRLLKFSREKKAAKTLAIVVGVFVLCWFPFFFVLPLGSLFPQLKPSEGVFKVIFWLGYFNSCVNPIIYPCSSKEFKRAFLRLLRCQCRRRRRRPLWRVYGHHWRASGAGPGPGGSRRDCAPLGAAPPAPPARPAGLLPGGPPDGAAGPRLKATAAFREWKLLGPFRKPTTQLRAKVSSLSHKLRAAGASGGSPGPGGPPSRSEVESICLGVPQDGVEAAAYHHACELDDYCGLRETDI
ncbi:LOW QUALITY PROTEIN: alpha-1D adrenergic receptor [Sminthopsis crassicaudata]|uniref:LOW QUALITY PROTEIN: alpha-1D adrenergic receptor n=1 Tax=Sminthopsis crassicaudata TaxID=9301 RepID=UPI003D68FA80